MKKGIIRRIIVVCVLAIVLGYSFQANANLTVIGQAQYSGSNYNLIWDNESPFGSIVWLDYSESYTTWQNQVNWAAGLNSGGVLTYNIDPTYNVMWGGDWRLPSTVHSPCSYGYNGLTACGYNITSSEMGHLFYTELGNKGNFSKTGVFQPDVGLKNKGPFTNLLSGLHWSGTPNGTDGAWYFSTGSGEQSTCNMCSRGYALTVRPGDVTVVPEPISSILFISGGALMAGRRYLKRIIT